jgi:hypothetical protein
MWCVGNERFDPDAEYLTRMDIARILRISTKQAGRLMNRMPILRVGRAHRRVLRADFDVWRMRERETPPVNVGLDPRQSAIRHARRYLGAFPTTSSGSVFEAAQALKKRHAFVRQTPDQTPDLMSPNDDN